jgi:hypothetical protein
MNKYSFVQVRGWLACLRPTPIFLKEEAATAAAALAVACLRSCNNTLVCGVCCVY